MIRKAKALRQAGWATCVLVLAELAWYWGLGRDVVRAVHHGQAAGGMAWLFAGLRLPPLEYCLSLTDDLHAGLWVVPVVLGSLLFLDVLWRKTDLLQLHDISGGAVFPVGPTVLVLVATAVAVAVPPLCLFPQRVFFSGDGGVKLLQLESLIRNSYATLEFQMPADPWVRALWRDYDAYPLAPPFVYTINGMRFMSHPMLFSLLCSVPYKVFGFRGLVILPILSHLALCGFLARCWRGQRGAAIRLICLSFCTPLFFYAMVFWEHATACALAAGGVLWFCRTENNRASLASGLLIGLAVFFRSETLALIPACIALAFLSWRRAVFLYLGIGVSVLGYALFNGLLYGVVIPSHAMQLEYHSTAIAAFNALLHALWMPWRLVCLSPALLIGLLAVFDRDRVGKVLLAVVLLYFLAVSFVVPNRGGDQFGPRYLMLVVPLLAWVGLNSMFRLRSRAVMLVCGLLLLLSFCNCAVAGYRMLYWNLATRVDPVIREIRVADRLVLCGHQFVVHECAAGLTGKNVVRVSADSFEPVMSTAAERGVEEILFVGYPDNRWGGFSWAGEDVSPYRAVPIGRRGEYTLVRFMLDRERSEMPATGERSGL